MNTMNDIHDIKPALAPASNLQWIYWAAAALILLALAALAWRWWRRRRARSGIESKIPELPPDVRALQQLDELAGSGCGDGKLFYFQLTAILRVYIEQRYGFPAAEMTTEELLPRIGGLPVPLDLSGPLQDLCRRSDPVKFAGAPADTGRVAEDLDFVRRFVHRTTVEIPNGNRPHDRIEPVDHAIQN